MSLYVGKTVRLISKYTNEEYVYEVVLTESQVWLVLLKME